MRIVTQPSEIQQFCRVFPLPDPERPGAVRPVMLIFSAPGCAPCEPAKKLLYDAENKALIHLLVVDAAASPALSDAYCVSGVPAVFILDRGGVPSKAFYGANSALAAMRWSYADL